MSLFFFRANEIHLFIDNKIRAIDKKVIQSCRTCKLSNRFCYVATKIFEKCVSCAISSRIIKKCEIIFIEYENVHSFHDDFVDVTFFSIFDFTNNFFVVFALLNFLVNYVVMIVFSLFWNLIEDEIHSFISTSCDNDQTNAKTIVSIKTIKKWISILKKKIIVWFNVWFIWRLYSNTMKKTIRLNERWIDSTRISRRWIKEKTIEWTFKITCMHCDKMICERTRFTKWSIKR